jgi:CTP:molybdopterin cytidylyltransferase MocA
MINILQLAAGKGSRFSDHTSVHKPFIQVDGMPMFQRSYESVGLPDARYHILFQQEHIGIYNPQRYVEHAQLHTIDHFTNGAATSAFHVINNSEYKHEPWLIIDCDTILDWDHNINAFEDDANAIFVQHVSEWDTKSSYSSIDYRGYIVAVAEKQPISDYRNSGHYYWRTGNVFVDAYNYYKDNDLHVLNEFYLAPLYNAAVKCGEKVRPVMLKNYIPIGTPVDLERYNQNGT